MAEALPIMQSSISVVIPCHNASDTVLRAIRSALVQSLRVKEVICIDDGSTDGTTEIVESIDGDGRVRLVRQENRGAPNARNHGLRLATGEFVQFLDADDELLPEKIAQQIAFAVDTQADVVCGSYRRHLVSGAKYVAVSGKHEDHWLNLMDKSCGITSANLFRREVLMKVGGWNESWQSSQEYELMFRVLAAGASFVYDPEPLTLLHEQPGSISSDFTAENRERYVRLRADIVAHLEKTDELHGPRREAALEMIFTLARTLYPFNNDAALEVMNRCVPPSYVPPQSATNTRAYLLAYRLLGFRGAERLRHVMRRGS